jgi:hypothetical protein
VLAMGESHNLFKEIEKNFSANEIAERKKFLGPDMLEQIRNSKN